MPKWQLQNFGDDFDCSRLLLLNCIKDVKQPAIPEVNKREQHAVLVDNIGTYGRKISTNSPLAQKYFDQGLRLVYGYYFPEAIASFREAQQYDTDHPMLDWGLALAMGPNPNSRKNGFPDDPHGDGKKAVASARSHLARATPAERALIEALSVRYDTEQYPDPSIRDERFIAATKSVLDRFPDDMEAQFLFADAVMIRGAWNYWRRDGSPLPGDAAARPRPHSRHRPQSSRSSSSIRAPVRGFEQAVRAQDALNFNEPPDWSQSVRLYLVDLRFGARYAQPFDP